MATLFETAMNGYAIADEMIKSKKGYDAAVEQYGEGRASAPGLFTALQNQDIAANDDRRADSQEARAERVDARSATTHDYETQTQYNELQEDGLLNMVQGLRQARDQGQDLGEAFDNLAGALPNLGVSEEDLPAMRQELLDNPDMLDSYYASLTDAAEQAQMIENRTDGGITGRGADAGGTTKAQRDVSRIITEMNGYYDELDRLGGIQNTDANLVGSIGRYMSGSMTGRFTGGVIGSEKESLRRTVEGLRPSLLQAIIQAEGMGARMFDSNADMQMWLATVTDPSQDIQTVRRLLKEFDAKNGIAAAGGQPVPIRPGNTMNSTDYRRDNGSDIDTVYIGYTDPETGAKFNGGDPGDPNSWSLE